VRSTDLSVDMSLLTLEAASPRIGAPAAPVRRVRVIHFCPWADRLQDGEAWLRTLPQLDLRPRVSQPKNAGLMRMARLDCDWHGENVRALGSMRHAALEFLPIQAVGLTGVLDALVTPVGPHEERWLVITGQHPQMLGASAERLLAAYAQHGIRILYYAFDEASRTMPCFTAIAPRLSVLIHDESSLAPAGLAALARACRTLHRSWVANLVPFAAPFWEEPEEKIVFLGSKLGLTPHRQRQIDFLRARFKDRFMATCDHSLPVAQRLNLGRYKVGFCPEGRKFTGEAMGLTHTDRPFWSGCLGMAPVSENSQAGGRLEELHQAGLIWRYPRGDLDALAEACERALAAPMDARRRVYDHFNRHETVGAVVAEAIAAAGAIDGWAG
jgi:hypothetical protein